MSVQGRTSTRDPDHLAVGLRRWASAHIGDGELRVDGAPSSAGRSSETVLFTVGDLGLVLRLPPPADAFPLFPTYDLARQATAMRVVAEASSVPVPEVVDDGTDESFFGAPYIVMKRVAGVPAPDAPPYTLGSWLTEATADQLETLERAMVDVLVGIHAISPPAALELSAPGDTPLRRHVANQRSYYRWIAEEAGMTFAAIDGAFRWLDDHWPADESPAGLSWGDARLANVLFRAFRPAAVLDWEAVATGPPEIDLGWFLFFHAYFQRAASLFDHPGLPTFLEPERVVGLYESVARHEVLDLDWYLVYAELRQALTSIRVSSRAVHFGEWEPPADPHDLIIDRRHLEEIVQR